MKHWQVYLTVAALAAFSSAAQARPLDNLAQSTPTAARVQVGVIIPFGGGGSEAERAPRLEAWSERARPGDTHEQRLRTEPDAAMAQPNRLGISFNHQPRLMLNGREVAGQDGRKGISALGWVGIGTVVVLVVGGVVLVGAIKDMNN